MEKREQIRKFNQFSFWFNLIIVSFFWTVYLLGYTDEKLALIFTIPGLIYVILYLWKKYAKK